MTRECREHEDGSATKDTKVTKHEHEGARRFAPIPASIELISSQIIGAAIERRASHAAGERRPQLRVLRELLGFVSL